MVVPIAGCTMVMEEQAEYMTGEPPVDSGRQKESGRSHERRHPLAHYLSCWRMEVHGMVLVKILVTKDNSVPEPRYQARKNLVYRTPSVLLSVGILVMFTEPVPIVVVGGLVWKGMGILAILSAPRLCGYLLTI